MVRGVLLVLLGLSSLLMAAGTAVAEEGLATADAPPPAGWQVVGHGAADTTSRCIGDPKTPRCAMETLMACAIRGDYDLCRRAEPEPDPGALPGSNEMLVPGFGYWSGSENYYYEVTSEEQLPLHGPLPPLEALLAREGLRWEIATREIGCAPDASVCDSRRVMARRWYIGQQRGRWVVLTIRSTMLVPLDPTEDDEPLVWRRRTGWEEQHIPGWSIQQAVSAGSVVISTEDATTTSRCIGDLKTPRCALETYLACTERDDPKLCSRVVAKGRFVNVSVPDYPVGPVTEDQSLKVFRIDAGRPVRRSDPTLRPLERWLIDVGATWIINTVKRDCSPEESICNDQDSEEELWYLGRQNGHWVVFGSETVF